jgi:excisionase family DNA binding protein
MKSEYLKIKEASEFLSVSTWQIYKLVKNREIPHIKKGELYFKVSDLEKWLESGRRDVGYIK